MRNPRRLVSTRRFSILSAIHFCLAAAPALASGPFTVTPNLSSYAGGATYGSGSLTTADFDGDGFLDVATSDYYGYLVSVMRGLPDGAFAPPVSYPTGTYPAGIVSGDLDGDTRPDLVTTSNQSTISVFLNAGDGTFLPRTDYPTALYPSSVALGDMTSDGILDVVMVTNASKIIACHPGVGNGTIAPRIQQSLAHEAWALRLGDVNNDGRLDAVLLQREWRQAPYVREVHVRIGNGSGSFSASYSRAIPNEPTTLAVGDLNGDSRDDIVVEGGRVFLSEIDGSPTEIVQLPVLGAVHIADVSHDGLADVVTPGSLVHGNGDGTFDPLVFYGVPSGADLVVTDVSGDGLVDLLVSGLNLVTAIGPGVFGTEQISTTHPPRSTSLADLDLDGDSDLVWGGTTGVHLRLNEGDGNFAAELDAGGLPNVGYLEVEDMDQDDVPDLAYNCPAGIALQFGQGDGSFGPPTLVDPTNAYTMDTGDLNADGYEDLVILLDTQIRVRMGLGGGAFGNEYFPTPSGVHQRQLVVVDLNEDGRDDLIVGLQNGSLRRYLAQPGGFLDGPVTVGGGFSPGLGDVNADGHVDLVVAGKLLLGDGAGNFTSVLVPALVGQEFAVGDVNGDGHADAFGSGNGFASLVLADAAASFPSTARYSCPAGKPLLGDLDGDGSLEGLVASSLGVFSFFRNAGRTVDAGPGDNDVAGLHARIVPNPARGPVTIEFSLPHTMSARVRVLDVGGRIVATLADGLSPAGTRRLLWNGQSRSGALAPAGVYWVELRTPERRTAAKFVRSR